MNWNYDPCNSRCPVCNNPPYTAHELLHRSEILECPFGHEYVFYHEDGQTILLKDLWPYDRG